jgi:hypothetical protein
MIAITAIDTKNPHTCGLAIQVLNFDANDWVFSDVDFVILKGV